jgi:hypothetical protein
MSITVEKVKGDLDRREALGLKKYGTDLDRRDLSRTDWLRHGYEEALDLANYLKRAVLDEEDPERLTDEELVDLMEDHYRRYERIKKVIAKRLNRSGYGPKS